MRRFVVLGGMAVMAATAAEAPTARALTELEMARMEAALLRRDLAQRDLAEATAKAQAIVAEACKSVGAEVEACDFDFGGRRVGKKPAAPEKGK